MPASPISSLITSAAPLFTNERVSTLRLSCSKGETSVTVYHQESFLPARSLWILPPQLMPETTPAA